MDSRHQSFVLLFISATPIPWLFGGGAMKDFDVLQAAIIYHKRGSLTPLHLKSPPTGIRSRARTILAMPTPVLSFTFLLLIFLLEKSAAGEIGNMEVGILQSVHPLGKIHARKVLVGVTMDYDYGGPNPKHDPGRKGKGNVGGGGGGGGGGKNP